MAARLDTMSARLRDLVLEGERALRSERPKISSIGWRDPSSLSRSELSGMRHRKTQSGSAGSLGRLKDLRSTGSLGGLPRA